MTGNKSPHDGPITGSLPQMNSLLDVMAKLRDPETGCAWDIKQTFESISPYTIEEAYEVADAIERRDIQGLREELGDLLLQVVFHSQMAKDQNLFEFEDVARGITDKMIERHPHVFGDVKFDSIEEQKAHWESLKQQEREKKSDQALSAVDGVALALPALTRAEKIQKRAARVGFDWDDLTPVLDKLDEELNELWQAAASREPAAIEDELGDLLFSVTNVARHMKVDPERALKKATAKFETRFKFVESAARADGLDVSNASAEVLDQYWRQSKVELP